jgi:Asp-tRNA(Asn)/Glu-tRNA(Gln) amidotransferase A subunit family amidase
MWLMTNLELISKLRETEECLLIELLELTSTEIVDAFLDRIIENNTYLHAFFEE